MITLTKQEAQQPEALRLADGLERGFERGSISAQLDQAAAELRRLHEVNEILRAKLSEPEPEPDWMERERAVGYREGHQAALKQREWVSLTDDEIYALGFKTPVTFARAIEAKSKEKNAIQTD